MVDLAVAIGVVFVLAATLVPTVEHVRETSRRAACAANLMEIGVGVSAYAAAHEGCGPQVVSRVGTRAPRSLLSRFGRYVNLGPLIGTGIAQDSSRFFCPSQTQFAYGNNPERSPKETVSGSYAYAIHAPAGACPRLDAPAELALASDDFVADLGMRSGAGLHAHKVGYNVLRCDGSVFWYADADESIWQRAVHWDDETDDLTYQTVRQGLPGFQDELYGKMLDIFRVWSAFTENQPDPFPPEGAGL